MLIRIFPRFAHVHLDDIEFIMNVVTVFNTVRVSIDTRVVMWVPSLAGAQCVLALLQAHCPVLLDFDGGQL